MSKLGWSYPPGVTRLPWENVQIICEVCLGDPEEGDSSPSRCICDECDICGSAGDPACYARGSHVNHGLEIRREHRPMIEERRRKLAEADEQDRLADLHLAQMEEPQQQEWQLQEQQSHST